MKELSRLEKATIRRVATSIKPLRNKLTKLEEKIAVLEEERESYLKTIEAYNYPVFEMTGGYDAETIVKNDFEIPEISDAEIEECVDSCEEVHMETLDEVRDVKGDAIANPSTYTKE